MTVSEGDGAMFRSFARALHGGADALREEFCRQGISEPGGQSVVLKALNGCAQDEQCRTENGLPQLQLFDGDKLVTDPNETGNRLQWQNDAGQQQQFDTRDRQVCAPATS